MAIPVTNAGQAYNLQIFGVCLLGVDSQTGRKLVFTLIFLLIRYLINKTLRALALWIGGRESHKLLGAIEQSGRSANRLI